MKIFNLLRYLIEAIAGALFGPDSHSAGRYCDDQPELYKEMDWTRNKWSKNEEKFMELVAKNMPKNEEVNDGK